MGKNKKYSGKQIAIVIWVPKDTVKLKMNATIFNAENEMLEKARMVLDAHEIAAARADYLLLDPEDDAFVTWSITPEFKEFIEKGELDGKTTEQIYSEWDAIQSI